MSKLKKNLGYQTIYQILNTCIPLITSPYLARVLGAEKQGVFHIHNLSLIILHYLQCLV